MKGQFLKAALMGALIIYACPAQADSSTPSPAIQMLPPTPLGSTADCPAGFQQVLSYSGMPASGGQGGINCVPVTTDAQGDLIASGYIQPGNTTTACTTSIAGAIRYNSSLQAFEGCNGSVWQPLGGSAPTGQVAYYQLANCPSGWVPANGTGGTVDLRGEFIRGWDNGRGVDSGRAIASWQAATAISNITYDDLTISFQNADSTTGGFYTPFDGFNCCGAVSSWFTVRPRNVALLACEKL